MDEEEHYDSKKNYVHYCTLPKSIHVIEIYQPNANIFKKYIRKFCLVSTNISHRRIFSKSNRVLEKERKMHLLRYNYLIHPFSDFSYYWGMLMIVIYFLQLFISPFFIIKTNLNFGLYIIYFSQMLSSLNIIVNFYSGYYREDIRVVVLDQKQIIWRYMSTYLVPDLLGSFPISFIVHKMECSCLSQRITACFVAFNIFSLMKYLETFRQKRELPFMAFRLLDSILLFAFGMFWFSVILFVGVHLDGNNKIYYNASSWWWIYNAYSMIMGIGLTEFCYVGYELFFSTTTIIFGVIIRNILLVQLILIGKTLYSSQRKQQRLLMELIEFCHYKKIPFNLRKRLLQYYKFKFQNVYYNENEIWKLMPENLRQNVQVYLCKTWFEADIFKLCSLALRQLITLHLKYEVYLKDDIIYSIGDLPEQIYYIKSGTVMLLYEDNSQVYQIVEGNFFAEKSLLENNKEPHKFTAIAAEPTLLFVLTKQNFLEIFRNYPRDYAIILDILQTRYHYIHDNKPFHSRSRIRLADYYSRVRRISKKTGDN